MASGWLSNPISLFVPEVLEAIYQIYRDEQLKDPTKMAVDFGQRWDFYHAVGALDGKDRAKRCPRQSQSKITTTMVSTQW